MINVTLDCNVLFVELDQSQQHRDTLQALYSLHRRRLIEIASTSRLVEDTKRDKDRVRAKRHVDKANEFPSIPTALRLGVSMIGVDVLADAELLSNLQHLFRVPNVPPGRPNTLWDVDHLYGHRIAGRDYFLTYEESIRKKDEQLEKLGIHVVEPSVFTAAAKVAEKAAGKSIATFDDLLSNELQHRPRWKQREPR